MTEKLFESSDSLRSNRSLAHARQMRLEAPFPIERGGVLPDVTICYETWGELSPERENVLLVCHALSGDSHVTRHDEEDEPGWWEVVVGPGRPIDTDRYYVICSNVLGGCRGSTGPDSLHPDTGERYGADFPTLTVGDMVAAQALLIEHLGIEKLRAVVGGSLGGHQALAWAADYADRVHSVIALATSARLTAQAIAFDVVGRNAILRDPSYHAGQYYDEDEQPAVGLALARMLGHITYLSQEAMTAKFKPGLLQAREIANEFERKFSVGSYLAHQGERFVERFDANSYLTLSMAMDLFDLGDSPEALQRSFEQDHCRWLVVSFSSDWLFPPFQSREVVEALIRDHPDVTYCEVETDCGHDAFLLEDEIQIYGELIRGFLSDDPHDPDGPPDEPPTRAFHRNRIDYDHIIRLIDPGSSVLDLACGPGDLLHRLRERGHMHLMGVERSEQAIVDCARRALPVIHGDIDRGVSEFLPTANSTSSSSPRPFRPWRRWSRCSPRCSGWAGAASSASRTSPSRHTVGSSWTRDAFPTRAPLPIIAGATRPACGSSRSGTSRISVHRSGFASSDAWRSPVKPEARSIPIATPTWPPTSLSMCSKPGRPKRGDRIARPARCPTPSHSSGLP
jgi:homoserine O-acetyltransferase